MSSSSASRRQQPQHQRQHRQAKQRRQRQRFGQVGQVERRRAAVKAKARLHAKGGVQAQRQAERAAEQQGGGDHRHALPQRVGQPAGPQPRQRVDAAAQRQAQQDGAVPQRVKLRQPGFGAGVIRRFLVVGQRHLAGKSRRHGLAMGAHMGMLARGQPQPQGQTQGKGKNK